MSTGTITSIAVSKLSVGWRLDPAPLDHALGLDQGGQLTGVGVEGALDPDEGPLVGAQHEAQREQGCGAPLNELSSIEGIHEASIGRFASPRDIGSDLERARPRARGASVSLVRRGVAFVSPNARRKGNSCPFDLFDDTIRAPKPSLGVSALGTRLAKRGEVTRAQPVFKNSVSFLTRRVVGQQFLLRPDPPSANTFRYTLGVSAEGLKQRVRFAAGSQMSNHQHLVACDQEAERSEFLARQNALLARSMNVLRKRKGSFWDAPTRKDKEQLRSAQSVLNAIVYTLCNPVAAGLVDYPHEWPGTLGDWRQLLTVPITATKPLHFHNQASPEEGGPPSSLTYYLAKPACFEALETPEYEALVREAVQRECERLIAARGGRPPLGVRAALSLPPTAVPASLDTEIDRSPSRFTGDPAEVARLTAAWIAWSAAYLEARRRWIRGEREGVEFPPGTDAYRRREDAPTTPLEPDSPFAFHT